jgi:ubiquinone/menaquinone biosynthesis C-methylase UbiE
MAMDTDQTPDATYVLGSSARELERLSAQARLYEPLTRQFFRDAGVEAGMRVLDVGCGGGDVSFLAARMIGPTGRVIGVDQSVAAVAMARRRALELELPNAQFMVSSASALAFEEPFDAAVGRLVLLFCPDPVAVLRHVAAQVRPGGVIAFQEPDWTGCRSHPGPPSVPEVPTFSRCVRWIADGLERSGADLYHGLKLFATFVAAGLPAPALCLHAPIGAGPDHPLYSVVAETVRTLLPTLERLGIATAGEVDVETLATRISHEAVAAQGTVVWSSLVGAAARKPAQQ